jgi:hypothetical protein
MNQFAVGYVSKNEIKAYFYGVAIIVEEVIEKHMKPKTMNIFSETCTIKYYDSQKAMMDYINERLNFLAGGGKTKFYDLSQDTVANL